MNPEGTIPTIDVDGAVFVGFDEGKLAQAVARGVERRTGARITVRTVP